MSESDEKPKIVETPTSVTFQMPAILRGYADRDERELTIAQVFNVYLLGLLAYGNKNMKLGPYQRSSSTRYQLDPTNDYWLEFNYRSLTYEEIKVSCRYRTQLPVLKAIVTLLLARYD